MLSVKRYINTFCDSWMRTIQVELQQLWLPGVTRSAELIGQRRSRISIFYTLAERHGALLTTPLAIQDTPHCPVPVNAIAAQLLRNGKYVEADRESTRLVSKEVSDRWRIPKATPVTIYGSRVCSRFQNTKLGKASRSSPLVRS